MLLTLIITLVTKSYKDSYNLIGADYENVWVATFSALVICN